MNESSSTGVAYRAHLARRLVECGVPDNLHDGLIEYIADRRSVGGFLTALLSNDLAQAIVRSDPITGLFIRETVLFLFNHAPSPCWGSPAAVEAWLNDPSTPPEVFD
jgi:hypothetical protein